MNRREKFSAKPRRYVKLPKPPVVCLLCVEMRLFPDGYALEAHLNRDHQEWVRKFLPSK
jgi:hypothetical protein